MRLRRAARITSMFDAPTCTLRRRYVPYMSVPPAQQGMNKLGFRRLNPLVFIDLALHGYWRIAMTAFGLRRVAKKAAETALFLYDDLCPWAAPLCGVE